MSGGPGQTVTVGTQSVVTTRKRYFASPFCPGCFVSYEYEFGADVGETRYGYVSGSGADTNRRTGTLSYARVGGVEYGTPTFPVSTEAPPAPRRVEVAVYPNPASHRAAVAFTLDAPTEVRLVLNDMLGREVATADAGRLGAGSHRLPLDVSMLPVGVYVWRLTADGPAGARTEAGRLTVAR